MPPKQLEKLSKDELYELAQTHEVPGRSSMDRGELIEAVREASKDGRRRADRSSGNGSDAGDGDRPRSRSRSRSRGAGGRDEDRGRPSRRALWKGAITFGLVTIPVGLYTAIQERDIHFNLLDARDGSRIRYKRVNAKTGDEVDRSEMVRGYEVSKGSYVTFTDEELERIPSESFRTIDVVQFVDQDQIDPIYYQTSYYVAPEGTGLKAYALMAESLERSKRVGLAKITLRDKERLAVLRPRDGVLILETINWPDEIRTPPFDPESFPPSRTRRARWRSASSTSSPTTSIPNGSTTPTASASSRRSGPRWRVRRSGSPPRRVPGLRRWAT